MDGRRNVSTAHITLGKGKITKFSGEELVDVIAYYSAYSKATKTMKAKRKQRIRPGFWEPPCVILTEFDYSKTLSGAQQVPPTTFSNCLDYHTDKLIMQWHLNGRQEHAMELVDHCQLGRLLLAGRLAKGCHSDELWPGPDLTDALNVVGRSGGGFSAAQAVSPMERAPQTTETGRNEWIAYHPLWIFHEPFAS